MAPGEPYDFNLSDLAALGISMSRESAALPAVNDRGPQTEPSNLDKLKDTVGDTVIDAAAGLAITGVASQVGSQVLQVVASDVLAANLGPVATNLVAGPVGTAAAVAGTALGAPGGLAVFDVESDKPKALSQRCIVSSVRPFCVPHPRMAPSSTCR